MDARKRFECFWNYAKNNNSFDTSSIKELLWRTYNQALVDCGYGSEEISKEETKRIVEDSMFIDFVYDCLLHPKSEPLPQNHYVKVVYNCTKEDKEKCVAWPDRCEEVGGDGEKCHAAIINLSKLCGVENEPQTLQEKILSPEDVKKFNGMFKE